MSACVSGCTIRDQHLAGCHRSFAGLESPMLSDSDPQRIHPHTPPTSQETAMTTTPQRIDEIGPSLRYAKAVVTRTGQARNAPQRSQEASGGAYGGGQDTGQGQQFPQPQTGAQAADPWGGQQTSVTF